MKRRQLLRTTGIAMAGIAGMSGASANDEADPRPSPVDGTQPNENVPTVETGPLGEQPWNFDRSDVPVGHWIVNNLTWISRNPSSLRTMLNNSVQTVTIAGEEFVLDEFDDWEETDAPEGWDHAVQFEYTTPPKPHGETYDASWNFESGGQYPYDNGTPVTNTIEVVGRNDR